MVNHIYGKKNVTTVVLVCEDSFLSIVFRYSFLLLSNVTEKTFVMSLNRTLLE